MAFMVVQFLKKIAVPNCIGIGTGANVHRFIFTIFGSCKTCELQKQMNIKTARLVIKRISIMLGRLKATWKIIMI